MIEKEELIKNFIKNELTDVPNILNRELSKNNEKFHFREEKPEVLTLTPYSIKLINYHN